MSALSYFIKVSTSQLHQWFKLNHRAPFPFQEEAWNAFLQGKSGLVNAPTGSGKTYSLALPVILACKAIKKQGLKAIWITPIRALSKDIAQAFIEAAHHLAPEITIEVRNGDTSLKDRKRQKEKMPDVLITTPESLHLLISTKTSVKDLSLVQAIIIDEWHELLGSKRGVQVELALAWLKSWNDQLQVWGISATIGNLPQAMEVLMGHHTPQSQQVMVRAYHQKKIEVLSILPQTADEMPWAGHLGLKLLPNVLPILHQAKTTLLFTNTRAQTEIWYQAVLEQMPELAGQIAMHHGSLSQEIRSWVEEQIHLGNLKLVICTSSLDLGVDFRPVEQIIQVGSPKGIARFLQRAGRSGHQPGAVSKIYFVPTHAIELLEIEAIKEAIDKNEIESRNPLIRSFDVLSQFMLTLSIGPGFNAQALFETIKQTYSFNSINEQEWQWLMQYLVAGGKSLEAYNEFAKLVQTEDGNWAMRGRKEAMQHRLSMGTIVGSNAMSVKYLGGGNLGTIEEYFAANLKVGDVFGFAGKNLELVQIKDNTVLVRKSNAKATKIPSWQGGRMPLSLELGNLLRDKFGLTRALHTPEFDWIKPILLMQQEISVLPRPSDFLIEQLESKDGHHLFFYTFEGRLVHEGLSALVSYRISKEMPISISMAMNDYGFELLSDQPLEAEEVLSLDVFSENNLRNDLLNSLNSGEMAKRKFRDIAHIAGLIFRGYPGKPVKSRHLQANSSLFFEVFKTYEPENLLFQQAYEEVLDQQYEENRLRLTLKRVAQSNIIIQKLEKPGPLAFPILVDRLRQSVSSETLADRVKRLELSFVSKKPKKKN